MADPVAGSGEGDGSRISDGIAPSSGSVSVTSASVGEVCGTDVDDGAVGLGVTVGRGLGTGRAGDGVATGGRGVAVAVGWGRGVAVGVGVGVPITRGTTGRLPLSVSTGPWARGVGVGVGFGGN